MVKVLLILVLLPILILSTVSVFAKDGKEDKGRVDLKVKKVELEREDDTPKRASGSAVICDPNARWKNHGEYVSCVARQHEKEASKASRSDIGKKKNATWSASIKPRNSTKAANLRDKDGKEGTRSATRSAKYNRINTFRSDGFSQGFLKSFEYFFRGLFH